MTHTYAESADHVINGVRYVCDDCGAHGCRLYRHYQTFLENQRLYCTACALKRAEMEKPDGKHTIGCLVAAVPADGIAVADAVADGLGGTFWGYTSVPDEGVRWWDALPIASKPSGGFFEEQAKAICEAVAAEKHLAGGPLADSDDTIILATVGRVAIAAAITPSGDAVRIGILVANRKLDEVDETSIPIGRQQLRDMIAELQKLLAEMGT